MQDKENIQYNPFEFTQIEYGSADYCVWKLVQSERFCKSCSLGHYGLDCRNKPIVW